MQPDKNYVIVSSRGEYSLDMPTFSGEGTQKSDPLISLRIGNDGRLSDPKIVAAGGIWPRHFSLSKDGTLVAVGLQHNDTVALLNRDVSSGDIGPFLGYAKLNGQVSSVFFAE